jgi:hypothetical protein
MHLPEVGWFMRYSIEEQRECFYQEDLERP